MYERRILIFLIPYPRRFPTRLKRNAVTEPIRTRINKKNIKIFTLFCTILFVFFVFVFVFKGIIEYIQLKRV